MRDYTKIEAWRLADDLTVAIYECTRSFPKEEVYGLTSQLRRAAYSVPANIVEGASRASKKDYLHFLYIARGSLSETQYFVHLAPPWLFIFGKQSGAERANEVDVCLSAWVNPSRRKRSRKTDQVVRDDDEFDRDRTDALVEWSAVRGLVVSISDSPSPSPNRDNVGRRRHLWARPRRCAPNLRL
jgi:four helix bundle protein